LLLNIYQKGQSEDWYLQAKYPPLKLAQEQGFPEVSSKKKRKRRLIWKLNLVVISSNKNLIFVEG